MEITPPPTRTSIRALVLSVLAILTVANLTASVGCHNRYISTHPFCERVNQLPGPFNLHNSIANNNWLFNDEQKPKEWLDQTLDICYKQATYYCSKLEQAGDWADNVSVKTAYKQGVAYAKSKLYTPDNEFRLKLYIDRLYNTHITPIWTSFKEIILKHLNQLRHQLNNYIESGSNEPVTLNEDERPFQDGMIENKLKQTARRILEYIDHVNQELGHPGMKQDEARLKAQEIIKSITDETTGDFSKSYNMLVVDNDSTGTDRVAFEIQDILQVALNQKTKLDEQLSLIQSKVSTLAIPDDEYEFRLWISALKSEVDHLRAGAENSVRERAKVSFQVVENLPAQPTIKKMMRDDVMAAQRAALKDLRQVYVKLYNTNKSIDKIVFEATAEE